MTEQLLLQPELATEPSLALVPAQKRQSAMRSFVAERVASPKSRNANKHCAFVIAGDTRAATYLGVEPPEISLGWLPP